MNPEEELASAQTRIRDILRDLEIATGGFVTDVDLECIDVTTMGDLPARRIRKMIRITLQSPPGMDWL